MEKEPSFSPSKSSSEHADSAYSRPVRRIILDDPEIVDYEPSPAKVRKIIIDNLGQDPIGHTVDEWPAMQHERRAIMAERAELEGRGRDSLEQSTSALALAVIDNPDSKLQVHEEVDSMGMVRMIEDRSIEAGVNAEGLPDVRVSVIDESPGGEGAVVVQAQGHEVIIKENQGGVESVFIDNQEVEGDRVQEAEYIVATAMSELEARKSESSDAESEGESDSELPEDLKTQEALAQEIAALELAAKEIAGAGQALETEPDVPVAEHDVPAAEQAIAASQPPEAQNEALEKSKQVADQYRRQAAQASLGYVGQIIKSSGPMRGFVGEVIDSVARQNGVPAQELWDKLSRGEVNVDNRTIASLNYFMNSGVSAESSVWLEQPGGHSAMGRAADESRKGIESIVRSWF